MFKIRKNRNKKMIGGNKAISTAPTQGNRNKGERYSLYTTPLFAPTVLIKGQLYYDTNIVLTAPNTGLSASYVFSANGLYDPDITSTGHQPMGFDQMMSLYEQYTCIASSMEVWIRPTLSQSYIGAALSLQPSSTISTDPHVTMENGLVEYSEVISITQGNGIPVQKMELNCDVRKYFGRSAAREMLNDDSLSGTISSNPTEQVYYAFSVWELQSLGGSTNAVGISVRLSYDTIYWEPKKETESRRTERKEPGVKVSSRKK